MKVIILILEIETQDKKEKKEMNEKGIRKDAGRRRQRKEGISMIIEDEMRIGE
jgi:hypothetical protein